ncbi:MAG TPA: S8 family peptidase [Candidatus Nanoarchaeia archaeon]|nr:S8 family peptidase [Candidatus Nanoarchaeia archaeon]
MKSATKFSLILIALVVLSVFGIASPEPKKKVLIGFKGDPDDNLVKVHGGDVKHKFHIVKAVAADIPESEIAKLKKNSNVAYVEEDAIATTAGKPVPYQPPQTLSWGIDRVDGELSWSTATGAGVKVAVIDTGIDIAHPDLKNNVKGGVNFVATARNYKDDNGHGTHVAGIISSENNGIGVVGVSPKASLYAVKVLDRTGSGYYSSIIAGLQWAVDNGMQVASMSLGGSADSQALHDAVDNAYSKGVLLVAASGNEAGKVSYPAAYSSVIAVSATDSNNNLASFSNYGNEISLSAPGVSIYSTYKGGGYATLSGTSMAAPHVSGAAALAIQSHPGYTNFQIRDLLARTSIDLGAAGLDAQYGYGLVNAYNAVVSN